MQEACYFQFIRPNHDGANGENRDAFYYPLGAARAELLAFVSLLGGKTALGLEHWAEDVIP
jgi:hypothetical protein